MDRDGSDSHQIKRDPSAGLVRKWVPPEEEKSGVGLAPYAGEIKLRLFAGGAL
jgi:hypothetical protein